MSLHSKGGHVGFCTVSEAYIAFYMVWEGHVGDCTVSAGHVEHCTVREGK